MATKKPFFVRFEQETPSGVYVQTFAHHGTKAQRANFANASLQEFMNSLTDDTDPEAVTPSNKMTATSEAAAVEKAAAPKEVTVKVSIDGYEKELCLCAGEDNKKAIQALVKEADAKKAAG